MNSGYLGGHISMGQRQKMIAKYLYPLWSFVRDYGVRNHIILQKKDK